MARNSGGALIIFCSAAAMSACTYVTPLSQRPSPALAADCPIQVYMTYQQALQEGPLEELCVIDGNSSRSFVHTVAVAIEKHKQKACACGATAVYLQSQRQTGWELATVQMVAFRRPARPASP